MNHFSTVLFLIYHIFLHLSYTHLRSLTHQELPMGDDALIIRV